MTEGFVAYTFLETWESLEGRPCICGLDYFDCVEMVECKKILLT